MNLFNQHYPHYECIALLPLTNENLGIALLYDVPNPNIFKTVHYKTIVCTHEGDSLQKENLNPSKDNSGDST